MPEDDTKSGIDDGGVIPLFCLYFGKDLFLVRTKHRSGCTVWFALL